MARAAGSSRKSVAGRHRRASGVGFGREIHESRFVADSRRTSPEVRKEPISDIGGRLLNHLVSDGEHFVGYLDPQCLGGLEYYDEIEFDRLLDRHIARFRALQNFVNISRGTVKQISNICSISH